MENIFAIENSSTRKLLEQATKFFFVGVMNTFVDLLILNIETILSGVKDGTGYALQKGASFLVAVIFSYYVNKNWTFEDKSKEQEGKKFSQFIFVSIIGMIINVSVATIVVTYLKIPIQNAIGLKLLLNTQIWVTIGGLCGTFVGLFWNFVGYKFWVFKK